MKCQKHCTGELGSLLFWISFFMTSEYLVIVARLLVSVHVQVFRTNCMKFFPFPSATARTLSPPLVALMVTFICYLVTEQLKHSSTWGSLPRVSHSHLPNILPIPPDRTGQTHSDWSALLPGHALPIKSTVFPWDWVQGFVMVTPTLCRYYAT